MREPGSIGVDPGSRERNGWLELSLVFGDR